MVSQRMHVSARLTPHGNPMKKVALVLGSFDDHKPPVTCMLAEDPGRAHGLEGQQLESKNSGLVEDCQHHHMTARSPRDHLTTSVVSWRMFLPEAFSFSCSQLRAILQFLGKHSGATC